MSLNSWRRMGAQPWVIGSSIGLVVLFLTLVLANLEAVGGVQDTTRQFLAQHFMGYLAWVVTIIMVFAVALALSPYGRVRLGKDGEQPRFSRFAWFSMLFSAGVGTGILFYGVSEPLFHLQGNPFLTREGIEPLTAEAAVVAQRVTLFHWGLHGWAVYSVVGLCLGYFSFRKGQPMAIRSVLQPLLGKAVDGPLGHGIDILAILSTLFGIAVSLGLGASQMMAGLNYLFGFEISPLAKLALIVGVSVIATASAVIGIRRGIRRLSIVNIWLSLVLIGFLLVAGPTIAILESFFGGTADYFATFLPMGLFIAPEQERVWQGYWTIFYWGWWISWGPSVGMFIGLVSHGRSVREYIFGTLLVPTLAGFLWLCVFGATAMDLQLGGEPLVAAVNADMTQALFTTFEMLRVDWATWAISFLATVLIISWFVTSCDSGTLIISTIACSGNPRPPGPLRILWGAMIGSVAGLLLLAGGLPALQAASTAVSMPFSIVLLAMMLGLSLALWRNEPLSHTGENME